ncbi:MAG: terminase family protein [Anaerolineae bacterium]
MTLHIGQKGILTSKSRFRVVASGRRFGKTLVGQVAILFEASQGHACWWLTPTQGMSNQIWRDLKKLVHEYPMVEIRERDHRIDFPNGGLIAVRSAHKPDNLRGAGLDFVVLDEAAFMSAEVWAEIVQPMLLERKGRALFLSSPNGLNWFWNIYQLGLNHSKPRKRSWRSFHFTSYDNPLIDPAELEAIRLNTPERVWKTEYLAEFLSDSGSVFRGVREAASAPLDALPVPGRRYVAGLDWARDNDYTCIAVFDAEAKQMVALERFNGVGWELQRGRVKALYERWLPSTIWAEANSIGGPNIEALQAEGLPVRSFTTSAHSKAPLIDALALALERRELTLLPDEVLLAELIAFRMERLPGGGYKYAAPAGGHDDTVIATALAWHGVLQGTIRIDFV